MYDSINFMLKQQNHFTQTGMTGLDPHSIQTPNTLTRDLIEAATHKTYSFLGNWQ